MSRRIVAAVLVALLATACMRPAYVQPEATQPHAVVKLRIVHHEFPKTNFGGSFLANDHTLPIPAVADPGTAATVAVRVRPEALKLAYESSFTHTAMRQVTKYRTEQYACGTQTIGSSTTTQYCSRQVMYTDTEYYTVVDASCAAAAPLAAAAGGTYLLQYDFYRDQQCALKCLVQTPGAVGEFALSACPVPPPPPAKN